MIPTLLGLVAAALAHPMHTSVADLRFDQASEVATVAIRVYSDDMAEAVPGAGSAGADSTLARYVRERFALADRAGRPIRLEWEGVERAADALILRLRAPMPDGLAGTQVAHLLLHDRFSDQVNVVRATDGRSNTTLLFLRGDGPKPLP